jgi:hypothetical protein
MSNFIPNSYQTPNGLIDEIMPLLTPEEWVVLSFATRRILGFKDKIEARQAHISLSQFQQCGLSKPAITKALPQLSKYGLLKAIGDPTQDGQLWLLAYDDSVDIDGLRLRKTEREALSKKRTEKARKTAGGKSDLPVSPTDQRWSVPLTAGGKSDLHNKDQYQTQLQTQDLPSEAKASSGSASQPTGENGQTIIPQSKVNPEPTESVTAKVEQTEPQTSNPSSAAPLPPVHDTTPAPAGYDWQKCAGDNEYKHLVPVRGHKPVCKKTPWHYPFTLESYLEGDKRRKPCQECLTKATEAAKATAHAVLLNKFIDAIGRDTLPPGFKFGPSMRFFKDLEREGYTEVALTAAGLLVKGWLDALPGKPTLSWDTGWITNTVRQSLTMNKSGITPDRIGKYIKAKYAEVDSKGHRFWAGKLVTFAHVASSIEAWQSQSIQDMPAQPRWVEDPDSPGCYITPSQLKSRQIEKEMIANGIR